jgi:hypothetical protein
MASMNVLERNTEIGMLDQRLIGIWSTHVRYGGESGAQSDDILILLPDGTGRYEFLNWMLCSADLFHWATPRSGTLRIAGGRHLQANFERKAIEEGPSLFGAMNEFKYQISDEETPSGKQMRVLRVALKFPMQECFGFSTADIAGREHPQFHLE